MDKYVIWYLYGFVNPKLASTLTYKIAYIFYGSSQLIIWKNVWAFFKEFYGRKNKFPDGLIHTPSELSELVDIWCSLHFQK